MAGMSTFKPDRSLLNPKFEGYKLDLIAQEDAVVRFNLEHKPTQSTASGRSPLSFQEVQSRITHNHLVIAGEGRRGLYIDAEHKVIVLDLAEDRQEPSFRVVYELPRVINSPDVDSVHHEYPSASFLDPNVAFVADGQGALYVLGIPENGLANLLGCYELTDPSSTSPSTSIPFRIHNSAKTSQSYAAVLLSSRHYHDAGADSSATSSRRVAGKTLSEFDVWAAQLTLPFTKTQNDVGGLDIIWRRRGEDVPIFATYDDSRNCYLLIGSSTYRSVSAPVAPSYEPSPDEVAPIPRLDENLNVGAALPLKPPPYSWTQTSDSVTVAFPLPATTPKSHIKVSFSQRTLTVHVQGTPSADSANLPHYSLKQLWDGIQPSSSFWTWDREGGHSFGLLTLHLDKQNENTRWMQVFTTSASGDDVEVPETLDPSELYAIRESLEKYTAALRDGEDASGLGLGRGVPALAQGEMDEEVDSSIGRAAFFTWVGEEGGTPAWASHPDSPFNLLSVDLPGSGFDTSLVVKNGIDGTLFSLGAATIKDSPATWTHSATYSALAFVLASKRDTRFTYHVSSNAVLAFENGAQDRGGNVYLYRGTRANQLWAKQSVLKVGDGAAGSLLGVGAVKNPQGKHTLVCLCENELVVMYDIV
ncbi:CS-domain-containing protein [Leucogyrophana mollusca]|uniref:CS-domain-containing protein n=1 Tax=Leucogyrophana mollusca TaxID=85980 RepID=A0ACB8B1Z5_9AGAM|nr:CS-domain-containing protein [Leucogyrophana mollusca]